MNFNTVKNKKKKSLLNQGNYLELESFFIYLHTINSFEIFSQSKLNFPGILLNLVNQNYKKRQHNSTKIQ